MLSEVWQHLPGSTLFTMFPTKWQLASTVTRSSAPTRNTKPVPIA